MEGDPKELNAEVGAFRGDASMLILFSSVFFGRVGISIFQWARLIHAVFEDGGLEFGTPFCNVC